MINLIINIQQMIHDVSFVELMKIPTFTPSCTAHALKIANYQQNFSLQPLCKTTKIASPYPVWLVYYLNQTDLVID